MSKLFKNSKQILALVMAFAVLAVSLFAGGIIVSAEDTEAACAGTRIEYWDGTHSGGSFTKGEGTATNPYIIENAKQLNWVCTVSDAASDGKYYKVDPDIKAFILQPQTVVTALGGDEAFMNIASAAETKALFEGANASTLKNWLANGNSKVFAGIFDGSGVAIYGCYANDAIRGTQQCALFPILDGVGVDVPDQGTSSVPTVIKNFSLKNSYFKGVRRVAAISSTAWWNKGGAKVNGYTNAEYIEVANCFLVGQDLLEKDGSIHTWNASSRNAEMGIAFGSMDNDPVKLNNFSIYGNVTEYRMYGTAGATYKVEDSLKFNRVWSGNRQNTDGTHYAEFHNSIVLGATATGMNSNTNEVTYVSNVYSDVKTAMKGVTVIENGFGPEGQAAMEALDWENDWFMGEYGPTLRAFHGAFSLTQTETTHYYACEECGLKSYGGELDHNWDADYKCTDCGWQCTHGSQTVGEFREGNCVTKDGYYTECHYCTWGSVEYVGDAPAGHELEWVDEILADCENTGRQGYWHCTVCGSNFTADSEEAAKFADPETSIVDPDTTLMTPIAPHNATSREDGSILVFSDETGHWWICYTCEGRLSAVESKKYAEEGAVKKHKYEDAVCVDCGWECTEHNYEATGKLAVVGTCFVDEEAEYKCTICGDKKSVVTVVAGHKIEKVAEVPATDKLEGTKEHYKCTVCKEIYLDAEGTKEATAAELIIAKTLPAGYENVVIGDGNMNTDTSNKSPSTGDSVASVLAVAALAGAALVFARKK